MVVHLALLAMVEDKKDDEKFDITTEGDVPSDISLDQAACLASVMPVTTVTLTCAPVVGGLNTSRTRRPGHGAQSRFHCDLVSSRLLDRMRVVFRLGYYSRSDQNTRGDHNARACGACL